jgi:hypothetical protein
MNLPASAVHFLDMFVGLYTDKSITFIPEIELNKNSQNGTKTVSGTKNVIYLTSKSQPAEHNDVDTFYAKVQKNPILPPHFDDRYESVVDDMDINDSRHHWSIIQQMRLDDGIQNDQEIVTNESNVSFFTNHEEPVLSITNPLTESGNLYIPSILDVKKTLMKNDQNPKIVDENNNNWGPHKHDKNLIAHCYCFVRDAIDPHGEALNLVEGYLGFQLAQGDISTDFDTTHIANIKNTQNIQNLKSTQGVFLNYENQLPILTPTLCDEISTSQTHSPLIINKRQQDYLSSSLYTQWKSSVDVHKGYFSSSRDIVAAENILLMDFCLKKDGIFIHHVRNVAPGKEMMCVSFVLPDYVLFYSDRYYKYLDSIGVADGLGKASEDNNNKVLRSVFDQTEIDHIDQHLWYQQYHYKNRITLTKFLQDKSLSQKHGEPSSLKKKNKELQNFENVDEVLSTDPNSKTRARVSLTPPLHPMHDQDENVENNSLYGASQPIKKPS